MRDFMLAGTELCPVTTSIHKLAGERGVGWGTGGGGGGQADSSQAVALVTHAVLFVSSK